MTPFIKLLSKQYVGLCVFSLPIFLMMIEIMSTLSFYHHQIGSRNYYLMFRARSQNSGMRCMPLSILLPNGCSTSLLVLNNLDKKNCSLMISDSVILYTPCQEWFHEVFRGTIILVWGGFDCYSEVLLNPESKVHGANMGPILAPWTSPSGRFTQAVFCLVLIIYNSVIWLLVVVFQLVITV